MTKPAASHDGAKTNRQLSVRRVLILAVAASLVPALFAAGAFSLQLFRDGVQSKHELTLQTARSMAGPDMGASQLCER